MKSAFYKEHLTEFVCESFKKESLIEVEKFLKKQNKQDLKKS